LIIVKNQILEFYERVHVLLANLFDRDRREQIIGQIVEDVPVGLSWRVSKRSLRSLVGFSYSVDSKHGMPCEACSDFIVAASKDLSPMKNPEAIRLLRKLRSICQIDPPMNVMFARKILKRCDGSAVIILHVSSLHDFVSMVTQEAGSELAVDLEDGVIVP
jgi:hypothetical protein